MKIQANRAVGGAAPANEVIKPAASNAASPVNTGWAAKSEGVGATSPAATEARTRAAAETFFKAFGGRDLNTLEAAYAPDVKFKDDMFTLTKRSSVMKMWEGAPPFKAFNAEILSVKGNEVTAKWTCDYEMFGNKIHNVIESKLTFDDQGRITSQQENWDEKKWMKQALPFIPSFLQGAAYMVMRPLLSSRMGG
jgi:hypothetical protein